MNPDAVKKNNAASDAKSPTTVSVLNKSIINLPGVGEKFRDALSKFKISTVRDIIFAFPYKYEVLKPYSYGERGIISGVFETYGRIKTKKGKQMLKAMFRTEYGFAAGVWLHFKGDYPANTLRAGEKYNLYGSVAQHDGVLSIFHPEFITDAEISSVRQGYSTPAAISVNVYRKIAEHALKEYLHAVPETLPKYIMDKYSYPDICDAIKTLHTPETEENALGIEARNHPAYSRFAYEELFYLQLAVELRKKTYSLIPGIKFKIDKEFLNRIKEIMPFKLTAAQRRVIVDIFNDMMSEHQMNRLVQGDVGSGKTVLAFIAGAAAIENGYQALLIAPTEVLAEQHFTNLQKFFKGKDVSSCIMTGSVGRKDKLESKQLIATGAINFIVGTHALLEDDVEFANLGLVIVDEQHRFGVHQRKILMSKGQAPDVLLMTATPIPRTLAMTLYGDLDVSIIDELPPGRLPSITKSYTMSKLNTALEFIKGLLDKGGRAYFVYPLISESDKVDAKAATESCDYIKRYYKDKNIGLLHGKMKADEKRELLNGFKSGAIDILVSTTVVEVGVDVPEATVMMIENAERFGLSQLHQLRGRVGRNDIQSYCILVTSKDISETGRKRISAMVNHTDGFKLAEIDLELRGQGDFFGTKQSGLPEFRFADIISDIKLLQTAKRDAAEIISNDPELLLPENLTVKETLQRLHGGETSYLGVG